MKNPGTHQYRVALRDTAPGKIGSASQVIEVPDLSKSKLTLSGIAVEDISMTTWKEIIALKADGGCT